MTLPHLWSSRPSARCCGRRSPSPSEARALARWFFQGYFADRVGRGEGLTAAGAFPGAPAGRAVRIHAMQSRRAKGSSTSWHLRQEAPGSRHNRTAARLAAPSCAPQWALAFSGENPQGAERRNSSAPRPRCRCRFERCPHGAHPRRAENPSRERQSQNTAPCRACGRAAARRTSSDRRVP